MARQKRAGRGEDTRERIIQAAIQAFANDGFEGASTRQIANLAGENQGLITYHFGSKEKLWYAAVDALFSSLRAELMTRAELLVDADTAGAVRLLIFFFVRYAARRPEQMRLMVQEGKTNSPRTDWLVDTHISPLYQVIEPLARRAQQQGVIVDAPLPNLFYAMVGATSLIFAHAQECQRLTGQSPMDEAMIEAHAETVCKMILRG